MKTLAWLQLSLGCASAFALAGCNNGGSGTTTTTTTTNPATPGTTGANTTNTDNAKLTIAVIPKGTTHVYWKSVQAGAEQAGRELGAKIVFKGPVKESDRADQIKIVQQFTSDKVSAIVLAPLDDKALVAPVKSAMAQKIPVVVIDSGLKSTPGQDYSAMVSTNNFKGGQLGGERLAKLLNGKGRVVMLRYQEGSASTDERERGFLDAIKKNPGIMVTSQNNYAGATSGEAKAKALDMIDQLREADGIFCPNESSTFGMLLALKQNGLAGKKKFVGFDASPQLRDGLNQKQIDALVVQNPVKMGYNGVKTAVAALRGEKVTLNEDTGVSLIDLGNLNTPAIKKVLDPQIGASG